MDFSPEQREQIGNGIREYLNEQTYSLFDYLDFVLGQECTIPEGRDPGDFISQLFSNFKLVGELVLPQHLLEALPQNEDKAINNIAYMAISTDYKWFSNIARTLHSVEEIIRANEIKGHVDGYDDTEYGEMMRTLFDENKYKSPRTIWIEQLDKYLRPVSTQDEELTSQIINGDYYDHDYDYDLDMLSITNLSSEEIKKLYEGREDEDSRVLTQMYIFEKFLHIVAKFYGN